MEAVLAALFTRRAVIVCLSVWGHYLCLCVEHESLHVIRIYLVYMCLLVLLMKQNDSEIASEAAFHTFK